MTGPNPRGIFERAATNVPASWLGLPVPKAPPQRNRTRAAHRKTGRKRTKNTERATPHNPKQEERTP